jgi:hypothetical protein
MAGEHCVAARRGPSRMRGMYCEPDDQSCHCHFLSVRYPVLRTDLIYRFVKEQKPKSFQ